MGHNPCGGGEVHEEFGMFDDLLHTAADYEFWCRIAQNTPLNISQNFWVYIFTILKEWLIQTNKKFRANKLCQKVNIKTNSLPHKGLCEKVTLL